MIFAFMVLINVKIMLLEYLCVPLCSLCCGKYLESTSVKIN